LRLSALEPDRHSLLAEVLLNLTKAVEILLTSDRDRLRETALAWGLSAEQVERQLIPLLLIRNQIDVAHPKMSGLGSEERRILEHFVIAATINVGKFLDQVLALLHERKIVLPDYSEELDKKDKDLFRSMSNYLEASQPAIQTPEKRAKPRRRAR
jgi:hypothetical protein